MDRLPWICCLGAMLLAVLVFVIYAQRAGIFGAGEAVEAGCIRITSWINKFAKLGRLNVNMHQDCFLFVLLQGITAGVIIPYLQKKV